MQRITKRLLNIALLFVAVLLLANCAMGPAYKKVDKTPDGMGVVYFYRPASILGAAQSPGIVANGVLVINRVVNGGYYPYFSKPGEVEFRYEFFMGQRPVTFYIEAGQTYYIRVFQSSSGLEVVPPEVGEKKIVDCNLGVSDEKILEMQKKRETALEEILLLKKAGVSDEKILEMQQKGGTAPQAPINAFDWNEDGKKDILTGSKGGKVYAYINKGTNQEPVFDNALEIFNVKVEDGESTPYVVDWNSDGKKDILAGAGPGEVSIFRNSGTNQEPMFEKEKKLDGGNLDVGSSSSPAVVDWNGDGKKDLVVGNSSGKVFVFINFINNKSPIFQTDSIETSIKVSGYARPFIVDWNNDGKFDVVSGSSDGKVYVFINEGDSKNPKFSKPQTVQVNGKELKLPNSTSVIALDWDDDGRTDLLVSNKEKNQLGMYLLLNTGTKEKQEFKELKPVKGKFKDDAAL